ncbi:protein FAR1-RELATED SEQUENCE 5-like [Silene latifolia]|uniref:protein FAR1-RELATED SEQUENCE 5-like n=1 Tax=Silene latifolia TaxID=37657 RepID=UPI003D776469
MKSVVPEVFKESTHRLCMWHIMKKLKEKVSYQLFQDEDFKTRLNRCVWNNQLEPDEFKEQRGKIMTDYQLVEHEWFSDLYDLRKQWIPAYFKDVSMSGLMRVTSRFESENSFFDRFLTPHLTLVEFWVCYESALEAQRHKQSKLNSDNKQSKIPRKTKSNLEVHASDIYSHNIFKDFQTELVAALSDCCFKDMEKIDETKIYILTDLQMPNKSWNVAYSPDNMEITCSCSMFREWVCCASTPLDSTQPRFSKIPNKDIMQRWTKDAMSKPVFDKDGKLIDVSQKFSDRKSLSTERWQEVYSCVSVAECDDNDMKLLIEKLRDIRLDLISNRSILEKKKDKMKEIEKDIINLIGIVFPEYINFKAFCTINIIVVLQEHNKLY